MSQFKIHQSSVSGKRSLLGSVTFSVCSYGLFLVPTLGERGSSLLVFLIKVLVFLIKILISS